VRGLARARDAGARGAGWDRAALFATGQLVALGSLLALPAAAAERASAHMVQHVLLGDLAPALLLVAIRGELARVVLPGPLRRAVAAAGRPLPALAAWAGLLWLWHVPPVYDAALRHDALHAAEHASFLLGGLLLWNVLIDPLRTGRLGLWRSLAVTLVAMVVAQMLVWLLVLSYRPLYAYGSTGDQSLAGLVMALEQLATLGAYAFVRLRAHFRAPLALADGHPLRV
jgi:cytochrome c oxidase assembly factor CtaG